MSPNIITILKKNDTVPNTTTMTRTATMIMDNTSYYRIQDGNNSLISEYPSCLVLIYHRHVRLHSPIYVSTCSKAPQFCCLRQSTRTIHGQHCLQIPSSSANFKASHFHDQSTFCVCASPGRASRPPEITVSRSTTSDWDSHIEGLAVEGVKNQPSGLIFNDHHQLSELQTRHHPCFFAIQQFGLHRVC